jgi:hypothetical protein
VAQLYPQALGFIFVAFYDSQSYGEGFEPASTPGSSQLSLYSRGTDRIENLFCSPYLRNLATKWIPYFYHILKGKAFTGLRIETAVLLLLPVLVAARMFTNIPLLLWKRPICHSII